MKDERIRLFHLVTLLPLHLVIFIARHLVTLSSSRTLPHPMPRRTDIHTILIIGSGPIVIGQGCEFDYSGVQACRALQGRGISHRPDQSAIPRRS